ncbi:unnamed protein product [Rotaria sp. Silwood1]|nr:unnamed protein product [Rotaria sp. Silwood1]
MTNTVRTQTTFMANKTPMSILVLPVELVYRVLDNLDGFELLCSVRNVCTRLNMITDTYHRYQEISIRSKKLLFDNALGNIESSPHTDKQRRWRAKKKDQHHRTQLSIQRLLNESHQYSSDINENFVFFLC